MANFIGDDPNSGNELEVMAEKLPRHILNLFKFWAGILAPVFRAQRAAKQNARAKAAVEAMQQVSAPPPDRNQNPALDPTTLVAEPNRTPPPRRKP